MSDIQLLVIETIEDVCKHFCKYFGTGNGKGCVYQQIHLGECPFNDLLKEIGEWHCSKEKE